MANFGLTLIWINGIKTVISFCPPNQICKYILMTIFVILVHATFIQLDINAYISYFKFQIMKFAIYCRYKWMPQFWDMYTFTSISPSYWRLQQWTCSYCVLDLPHTRTQNENEFKLPHLLQMAMITMLH